MGIAAKGVERHPVFLNQNPSNEKGWWEHFLDGAARGAQAAKEHAPAIGSGTLAAGALGLGVLFATRTRMAASVGTRSLSLFTEAKSALTSSAYWKKFAMLGTVSAAIRGAYDFIDAKVLDSPKEEKTVAKNAAYAFLGGGLCGGLFHGALAYHYVALDVLGDFSQKYLTDIRERHGNQKGVALAGGLLFVENAAAAAVFVPLMGSWGKAVKTAATVTALSVGLETYLQGANGKTLKEIDPGRFVGMSAWGHSIVVLPEAILNGTQAAVGLASAAARAVDLGTKYIVFVNPSVNNFSARVNRQNWKNVQLGNTTRHATIMMASRFIQSLLRPSHPLAMVADEGLGAVSIALVNKIWPFYEDIPGFQPQKGAPPTVASLSRPKMKSED